MDKRYVIGVDFGSDSARALVVDALTGGEISRAVAEYPRWALGKYQDAARNLFRQHPLDYIEALSACVNKALDAAGETVRENVAAISVDTTGSTPCPVDRNGVPLALLPGFEDDPNAMFHLWKDHTAIAEAARITDVFKNNSDGIDYTRYQGACASEWFWAKILHTSKYSDKVRSAAWSWVEHSDWMPSLMAGNTKPETMYRCACAAGHKAYWHSSWGGLPSKACLSRIDPVLLNTRDTYGVGPLDSTHRIGYICGDWARKLSVGRDVLICGSSFDSHAGGVGAGVNGDRMIVNLGTSAVNLFVTPAERIANAGIFWLCGAAENSIIPGLVGLESGQAAFGDVYAWFKRMLTRPFEDMLGESRAVSDASQRDALIREMNDSILPNLQRQAEKIDPEDAPVALDWFNGRRYPNVNESAQSAITGLSLACGAGEMYRALITATALGQKRIIESLEKRGIRPKEIIAVGGIAQKSPLLMQTLSDTLGKRVHVSVTKQACARGAAMYAAVGAGLYDNLEQAQRGMCEGFQRTYAPNVGMFDRYSRIYEKYLELSNFVDASAESCPA